MLETNRFAFKEWASVVQALGAGKQILILRKGGIHEKGKRFDVTHEEFFLFPTFEHQNPKDLKPKGQEILFSSPRNAGGGLRWGVIPIQYYCVVENSFWISDEKTLEALDPFHIWSPECIKARYEWGNQRGLFGIVIRTYTLPKAIEVEDLKRYGGCRSWVELETPLETSSLRPVLSDPLFKEKKGRLTYG